MARLEWDKTGERIYETGVNQAVLYPKSTNGTYPLGVAWNGITSISQSPSGAENSPLYADNIKYLNLKSVEEYGGTIEAYTYPEEFEKCDGTASLAPGVKVGQQPRVPFGLSYRTVIGNDAENDSYGYKLHLVYGADASPSEKSYSTINDSPDAITFSWEFSTTPVNVPGMKPTALIEIDSTKVDAEKLKQLEDILYGTNGTATTFDGGGENVGGTDPRLPLPDEVAQIFAAG